ncbi:pyruvate:ferredoxin (flavodoxin) oxidoreductase [Candidatus Fermentibacteria bacterium]|nr:MAG: pyruvate:ferredoxin (flavodoxin) oxidoreductase [Candidatus Fermentibacteria bacterium]PIE52816.1 MAG: pyruvate:ferredoxin (flavodoxin) oxidoreductase [Candidatus Fermentibacteria bacterium]
MSKQMITVDGNEAAARVAHKLSEVIAIYPITPSSPMGEHSDAWSAAGQKNIWGTVPLVQEMQSEGGASAAVHGALQTGALTTTFTASQGLLLMIPTMYKVAGELTPAVFHVSARSLAAQALSIFGDHSDVMAVRNTGFALLASSSVQEVTDLAAIAHAATLKSRIPFIHFFDGFRTSHEIQKIEPLADSVLREMIDDELVIAHRHRGLNPNHPVVRGTSQNPDVYFQGRESVNPYYKATPAIVQEYMNLFAKLTGRQYNLFDYVGAPDAEHIVMLMGSGCEVAHETVEHLTAKGEKVGLIKVRLFRPFDASAFVSAIPASAKTVSVLDRTKEPGNDGEPLYKDVATALAQCGRTDVKVLGGRYGLSSKEFCPSRVAAVFNNAKGEQKNSFTVGINDDVTNTSLEIPELHIGSEDLHEAVFLGLGSDGTVGANKNSIKIIGGTTDNYAQGYFVYDSKKAGALTVSHLRFGPNPIRRTCLISKANFVACHQTVFMEKYDVLKYADKGATFLLNTPYGADEIWNNLPEKVQRDMIEKELNFYVIDAYDVARKTGMGVMINTIMQTCFFAISGVLPPDDAIAKIKDAIQKTYGKKGEQIVQKNFLAVDQAVANLHKVEYPKEVTSTIQIPPVVSPDAPEFVQNVTATIMAQQGDNIPVSAMPADGTWPTGTTQWEKRNIALEIPVWDPDVCIQCGLCNLVCPHAAIRMKYYDKALLENAPETFKHAEGKARFKEFVFTNQVAPEDCTGCGACVHTCPAKNKAVEGRKAINMEPQPPLRNAEKDNYKYFLSIPDFDRTELNPVTVKESQLLRPLFEYSGACAGCGETPYVKLLSQLFGDRAVIANATGCSSIYGGNLPTTPYATDPAGRGPSWNNSLFEDAAEFGFGFRLTADKHTETATELLRSLGGKLDDNLIESLLESSCSSEIEIAQQRERVEYLRKALAEIDSPEARQLESLADYFVPRSVWILGGDGWAYDIGYGGLDHVLAQGRNVNVLVMDTGVYSNTGGQCSKATPMGAVAKFAAAGKPMPRKDLAMISMTYGNIYVAQIAMGANWNQAVKAFNEAESYDGPSIILAYSHCIAHGINMTRGMNEQKNAVSSGMWPLFRFDPRRIENGDCPLQLDSRKPSMPFRNFAETEVRWNTLIKSNPDHADRLIAEAQKDIDRRFHLYQQMAQMSWAGGE